ncbi:MAG: carbohydrate ABC transporter permease, partial [Oscillospiraceae bacterium]
MKKTMGQRYFTIINATLLIIASVLALYPILYVLFASFSDPAMFAKHTGLLFKPEGFSLEAYKAVFEKQEIFTGYKNTIIYLVAGTFINLVFTVSLAYVLSRPYLYWQKFMMVFVVFTMYFNGGLVPTYLLVQNLGLADTRWAILLPTAINTFNLILMRNGFMGIPVSLEEAAKIDGASPLQSLVKIILPLSMPTIAVVVLYYGVAHWNSWFQAMIYL